MIGKDETYEVTQEESNVLRAAFHGYIFRRTDAEGKHWVKAYSPRDKNIVENYLNREK